MSRGKFRLGRKPFPRRLVTSFLSALDSGAVPGCLLRSGFGEVKRGIAEVGEKVDAVYEKVSKSRRGKKRGKYDEETIAFCAAILSAAESNATIKNGLNTRVTHDAVFSYNRRELVQRGVSDVAEFTRIIRAHQAREQRRREKSAAQTRPKNGIMRGMRKNAKNRGNNKKTA